MVSPTLGTPLSWHSPRRSEADFLKLWLHYFGPERVLAWAAEHDPSIEWEGRYAHPCQACGRVYKDERVRAVIREHYREMVAIVLQSAWLDDHFTPSALREDDDA